MNKQLLTFVLGIVIVCPVFSQTMQDTIYAYKTKTPIEIDGQATEDCWANAEWHAIDQVWIPYGETMKEGDFEGRFKTAWDENYLYLLVEVVDDSLSDNYPNPLDRFWEDDCVEVFIDENRSGGEHEKNYNAFAYHVSLFYDVIDLGDGPNAVNLKDHIDVFMDTIGPNKYLWEMAIKLYDASFRISNPEASRVYLTHNKLMGFAVAYCDSDASTLRENFIGSMEMPPPPNNNNMYKNADHFGPLLCINQDIVASSGNITVAGGIEIYPVPVSDIIQINLLTEKSLNNHLSVFSISGKLIREETFSGNTYTMNIEDLDNGMFIVQVKNGIEVFKWKIVKQ